MAFLSSLEFRCRPVLSLSRMNALDYRAGCENQSKHRRLGDDVSNSGPQYPSDIYRGTIVLKLRYSALASGQE